MKISKIHIIDYGLGNLFSVASAIKKLGKTPIIADAPQHLQEADFVILPGVGAFQKGMNLLEDKGFKDALLNYCDKQKPLLGICLGMQMLFESSSENGSTNGLGLIPGHVKKIAEGKDINVKIPHIGWKRLEAVNGFLANEVQNHFMYFVHSFHPLTDERYIVANTIYQGIAVTAMVQNENLFGCQFHPEKSGEAGLSLLKIVVNL